MNRCPFGYAISLAFAMAVVRSDPALGQASLGITGVTVIDGTDRPPALHQTIVIRDGRITAVGPDGSVTVPRDARRLDGNGKYAIPGLWDMHVHLGAAGRGSLSTLLSFGITSVRDLGGKLAEVRGWRDDVRAGRMIAPRIMVAGPIIENAVWLKRVASLDVPGLEELASERLGVETVEDAVRAVDSISRLRVDLIKIRNSPPPAAYSALLAAAKQHHLLVAGHQPSAEIGLGGTLAAGQRSIEHIEGLGELEALPADQRDSLARAMAAAELWITPTFVASFQRFLPDSLIRARAGSDDPGDPNRGLVTPELRRFWRQQLDLKKFDSPLDQYQQMVTGGHAGMRRLRAAGVKVLAGTDLGGLLLYPGASLHDELALMVDSLKLTPLQAIQSATVEPARFFEMTDSLGTAEPGKVADLLILDADPLADIRNTRRIGTVIVAGRVVSPRGKP